MSASQSTTEGQGPQPSLDDLVAKCRQLLADIASGVIAPEVARDAFMLLADAQDSAASQTRASVLLEASQAFYFRGKAGEGRDFALAAHDSAQAIGDRELFRRCCTLLGIISADMADVPSAVEWYSKAIVLARELGDVAGEVISTQNLGVALLYAGQYEDALACFDSVLHDIKVRSGPVRFRVPALSNSALCCMHVGDVARGVRYAEQAIAESEEPTTPYEQLNRLLRECNYIPLLIKAGDIEKAASRCEVAAAWKDASERAAVNFDMAHGLYLVSAGRHGQGMEVLARTLDEARKMGSMTRDVLETVVEAQKMMGQPQRALVYLREITQILEHMNTQEIQRRLETLAGKESAGTRAVQSRIRLMTASLEASVVEEDQLQRRYGILENAAVNTELRTDPTGRHPYRVGFLAEQLALDLGMSVPQALLVARGARVHDLGKMNVPSDLVAKKTPLTEQEASLMRLHARSGADLVARVRLPDGAVLENVARHHHERWDGAGYPDQLWGEAIPVEARIVALADAYDTLAFEIYAGKPGAHELALADIEAGLGSQFDPRLGGVFLAMLRRLRAEHSDLEAALARDAEASAFLKARAIDVRTGANPAIAGSTKGNAPRM